MKSVIMVGIILVLLTSVICCGGTVTTTTTPASTIATTTPTATLTASTTPATTPPATTPVTTTPPTSVTPPTTLPPSPTVTTGQLTVYCNLLLGDIYLDDEMMGYVQGSYGATYDEIEAGIHTVKITSSGWGTWTKQVEIVAGKETIIYGYLALGEENTAPSRNEIITPDSAAAYGTLEVYCGTMQANIYVGGETGGPTSASGSHTIEGLLPGTYTVQIMTSGWAPWTKQVKIETGKTTVLYSYLALGEDKGAPSRNEIITPDMAASYGSLTVYCNLLLGNIYVNDEPGGAVQGSIGKTIGGLLPGTYTVRIVESGWHEWTGQVTITAGQTTEITAEVVQNLG
jgi:hypothetical protein